MSVFIVCVRLNAERIQCCRKLLDSQYWKKQIPCPTHSCLKDHAEPCTPHLPLARAGNPAHATPTSLFMYALSLCRCCKQHLAIWFLHLQCWTRGDVIKNSIIISKSNSHSKCISILPSSLHTDDSRWMQEACTCISRGIAPLSILLTAEMQKNAQKTPGKPYLFVVWATLCRWESNSRNPQCPLQPCAWVRDLAAETMQVFPSAGRAVLQSKPVITSVLSWCCGWWQAWGG